MLTAIYHMLKDGTLYQDLGPNYLNPCNKERQKSRLIKRLADLGYVVELAPSQLASQRRTRGEVFLLSATDDPDIESPPLASSE